MIDEDWLELPVLGMLLLQSINKSKAALGTPLKFAESLEHTINVLIKKRLKLAKYPNYKSNRLAIN